MTERYDGDDRDSRTAFRAYDSLSEPVSTRTPWQIWRDACAWQASRATPATPVMWFVNSDADGWVVHKEREAKECEQEGYDVTPLYAGPPNREPTAIYQVRLANGSWQDINERAYQYNLTHCPEDSRIVYAAPQPSQSEAQSVRDAWVSVDERLPEKNLVVLCGADFYAPGDWRMKIGYLDGPTSVWKLFGGSWTPTHWQPLPAPPQKPVSDEVKP